MLIDVPKWVVKPHPIRKRAWHRAHKRGLLWIVYSPKDTERIEKLVSKYSKYIYDPNCGDNAYILWPL